MKNDDSHLLKTVQKSQAFSLEFAIPNSQVRRSKSAFFNPGVLLAFTLFATAVCVGAFGLAAGPSANRTDSLAHNRGSFGFSTVNAVSTGCIADTWTATNTASAPTARYSYTAVWTGSEMIVWGGQDGGGPVASGGRYNPASDTWTPISTINAPEPRYAHTAVWTGSEMIVWGGHDNSGAVFNNGRRYNPANDTWSPISRVNAPDARHSHSAVWTGSEMIVWGGEAVSDLVSLNTGARYNPITDTWTAISMVNAPVGREWHTAVWTGTEMVVWGGTTTNPNVRLNTGGRYNPATDSWSPISMLNAPEARYSHTAVWTGSEMLVWGGDGAVTGYLNTGARYSPTTDSWNGATSTATAPDPRYSHTAVWTGSEMIVWGGLIGGSPYYDTGGRYNPSTDTWTATSITDPPTARAYHTAVWTGGQMVVWGGFSASSFLDTGGKYCVEPTVTPTPTPTPTASATATPTPSHCSLPGFQLFTDPSGDQYPNSNTNQQLDLLDVNVAEPFTSSSDKSITFTIDVQTLGSTPPPDAAWRLNFYVKDTTGTTRSIFVQMDTQTSATPSFNYGFDQAVPGGGTGLQPNLQCLARVCPVTGSFTADGTITIKVDVSQPLPFFSNANTTTTPDFTIDIQPGTVLSGIVAQTVLHAGTYEESIDLAPSNVSTVSYVITGNDACSPNWTPPPTPTPTPTPPPSNWTVVPSQSSEDPDNNTNNFLTGVACSSPYQCWAVGSYNPPGSGFQLLMEQWDGRSWSFAPGVGNDIPLAVTCVSAKECYAVGYSNGTVQQTRVWAWNGSQWTSVPSPNTDAARNNLLQSVACAGTNDCWAVGYAYAGSGVYVFQTLVEHWDGNAWSIVTSVDASADYDYLSGIACASSNDCWAVGATNTSNDPRNPVFQTLAEHWDGNKWSIAESENPDTSSTGFSAVSCSHSNCWAVGQNGRSTLIEKLDNNRWVVVPSPNASSAPYSNALFSVSCGSASNCMATGWYERDPDGAWLPLVESWDGNSWTVSRTPDLNLAPAYGQAPLEAVTCSSDNECWAVGSAGNPGTQGGGTQTLIEHYTTRPTNPISAVSRKTHGTAGTFDVDLLGPNPETECRAATSSPGDYQLVIVFPVSVRLTSATISSSDNLATSDPPIVNTSEVTLNLHNVANAQTIKATLNEVDDGSHIGDVSVSMRVLQGDANGDGFVNSADIGQTKSQSGQAVTNQNFREDLTVNGLINSADIAVAKSKSGTALP